MTLHNLLELMGLVACVAACLFLAVVAWSAMTLVTWLVLGASL